MLFTIYEVIELVERKIRKLDPIYERIYKLKVATENIFLKRKLLITESYQW
jgi:hypothetical protein